jgi:hypothetical protein
MGNCHSIKNKKISYPTKTLKELKDSIQSFDLICFRGSEFVSNTISKVENAVFGNGEWTHVGIVIKTDILDFKNGKKNKIYIWESTMSGSLGDGVNSEETNQGKFGVQIRDLDKVIEKYIIDDITKIGWCKLLNNPLNRRENDTDETYNRRLKRIKRRIKRFYINHGNATYDFKIITFAKTIFPFINKNRFLKKIFRTKDLYFCSELVATIYKLIHVIDKSVDPEDIAPVELLGYTNDNIGKIVAEPILLKKN